MTNVSKIYRTVAALAVLSLVVVACGGGDDTAAGGDGEPAVIRFAFAPDPVWDYLVDTGTMAEWEEEFNLKIETSESWDEFAYFAGGHGDIVSMGTHELPVLEGETGVKTVTFGAYNHQRVPMYTRAEDGYNTLADVPLGSTTCMSSSVSNTIVWSIIADQLHGLNYRVGEGDFDIVVQDHFVMPELVVRGECTVAAAIPEAAVPYLRAGELEIMYDGRSPWRVYQEICDCDHRGIMSNLFVATEEWYDANPEQAAAFLVLWERGIKLWQENKAEIVEAYPQHFSVESQEDIDWIIEFMEGPNDWFVQTVYLDQAWVDEEMKFYDLMIEGNWMDADDPLPRFEIVTP
jgi:hypothetical protein